jgi:hypothetical protein
VNYVLVFDAGARGYSTWTFAALGLPLVAVGIGLVKYREALAKRLTGHVSPRVARGFTYFFLGFTLLWTALVLTTTRSESNTLRDALRSGSAPVVEGRVEGFVPMPYTGHALERFTVCGVPFSYSDYEVTEGFHRTSSHGGPLREGSWVRITHVGNLIARLEIARDDPGTSAPCRRTSPQSR